jgi:hypothetical protein
MAQPNHTEGFSRTEDAVTVLFCLTDDAYAHLNAQAKSYESIKRLSDSGILALALLQQSSGASRASALSSGMPSGSSRTCSPGSWVFTLPRSTAG